MLLDTHDVHHAKTAARHDFSYDASIPDRTRLMVPDAIARELGFIPYVMAPCECGASHALLGLNDKDLVHFATSGTFIPKQYTTEILREAGAIVERSQYYLN